MPGVRASNMLRFVRSLACVMAVVVTALWPCVAAAGDPQPSAIAPAAEQSALPAPFNSTSHQPSGRLLEKWNAAAIELRIDIDVIAACRADLDACESDAAKRLIAIVDEATKREGRARVGVINRAVNLAIAAASDMAQYGVEDKWASPLTTFASGRGDCEDYALAKYAALRAAGFASDDLRLVIVHLPQSRIDHAVLSVRDEGRWLILDNRRFAILDAAHLDAVPLFALREDNAPVHVAAQFPDVPYLL
jgi:predicted transglutaminase-like cysteine proteinase